MKKGRHPLARTAAKLGILAPDNVASICAERKWRRHQRTMPCTPTRYSSGATPVLRRWIDRFHALPARAQAGLFDDLIRRCPEARPHLDHLLARYTELNAGRLLTGSGAADWPPLVALLPDPDDDGGDAP